MRGSVSASRAETVKVSLAAGAPGETLRVLEALRDEALPLVECLPDAFGNRLGALGIEADRCVAGGFVQRRMRRGGDRRPARHCLDDRDAESLEERRVDECARAAVESRKLGVRDETQ